jgi:hypothetical protein
MSHAIEVGDTVAYSDRFLDRQHVCPSNLLSARGKVKVFHRLDNGVILADIEWNNRSLPKRVNAKNLTKITDDANGD